MHKTLVSVGTLTASLLTLGFLIGAVRLLLIWWAVAASIGHRAAAILLVPVGLMVLVGGAIAQIAKLCWEELRDINCGQEAAEQRELQNSRDDIELAQGKEEL
jgi:hypothetical protein